MRQIWRLAPARRRVIWDACGYAPSPGQWAAHIHPARCKLVAGGERGGKSLWTAQELHTWLYSSDGIFWIVGPTYELARPEFIHLIDAMQRADLLQPDSLSMPRSGACQARTRLGATIVTKSGQDPETLAGIAPSGVAMVEAAQQSYETYLRLRGRVAEKRGPFILSGTFEGSLGWYPELWQSWQGANADGGQSFSLPTWSNRAIFPGGRDDPEIKALEATFPADVFMERFGAVPCPPATLVFKEFSHLLHVRACYHLWPEAPSIQLWIDPGYAGAYAVEVACVVHGEQLIIDEIYRRGVVGQEIIREAKAREWWPKAREIVIDVAGKQHPAMESQVELWARETGLPIIAQPVPVADGILRHRTFLVDPATGRPRLWHDPRCKGAISEYGLYKYPEVRENRPEREEPIDRDNHAMKAIAYGLVANYGYVAPPRLPRQEIRFRAR